MCPMLVVNHVSDKQQAFPREALETRAELRKCPELYSFFKLIAKCRDPDGLRVATTSGRFRTKGAS
jgi:hypothetical protein